MHIFYHIDYYIYDHKNNYYHDRHDGDEDDDYDDNDDANQSKFKSYLMRFQINCKKRFATISFLPYAEFVEFVICDEF